MRNCRDCSTDKPLDEFYKYTSGFYATICKACNTVRGREYYRKNKARRAEAVKAQQIKYKYGLTADVYYQMVENGCQVCGSKDDLCVDHDHACCPGTKTCGKCVRGILCRKHNSVLGLVNDNAEELRKIVEYLGAFSSQT